MFLPSLLAILPPPYPTIASVQKVSLVHFVRKVFHQVLYTIIAFSVFLTELSLQILKHTQSNRFEVPLPALLIIMSAISKQGFPSA